MCLNIAAVLLDGDGTCVLRWYLRRVARYCFVDGSLLAYGDADAGDCCCCCFSFSSSSSSFWLLLSVTFSFLLCPSNATTFV